MKVLLLLLASLGSAAAAPTLPAKLPRLAAARLAEIEAEFRARHPQRWQVVELDPRGFVKRVRTAQPVAPDELLRASADLFGIDAADVARLQGPPAHRRFAESVGEAVLAAIDVRVTGRVTDIAVTFRVRATPTVTEGELRARLIGQRYDEVSTWEGSYGQRDCGMAPPGARRCPRPVHTRTHPVTLAAGDLRVRTSLIAAPDDTLHLVHCIDAGKRPFRFIGHSRAARRTYTPTGGGPALPLVVDAVTGAAIATTAQDCRDRALSSVR